ncbi:Gldg family protein [Desulfosarcina sp. OttesenSCG-928-A07]|nr:Gldg family protein [Desulfosarcina sp. OttesenSCG-928-G17]MDL2328445.1 Gldg family protein [Desulfosarcina sp. OttesenSCG-928-A07]
METTKKNRRITFFSIGSAVLVLVMLILVNLLFARTTVRWDTTQGKLYSLSKGTKTLLSQMDQDVVIKVFYSRHVVNFPPQIKIFAQRVMDFLAEYEQYGKGRIRVELYDPIPDSEEEEWAIRYGIKGLQLPTGESVYLGLVALCADQEAALPFLDPSQETRLEYDLTRLISQVQRADRLKIAIYSELPVFGGGMVGFQQNAKPWFFIQELEKTYDLVQIQDTTDAIDPDIPLLILIHPSVMSDTLSYAVDQYVLGGGNAIVFADPLSVMEPPSYMGVTRSSIPDALFKAWGITLPKGKAVADYTYASRLRNPENQMEDNPMWLSVQKEGFNSDQMITANLEFMLFPVAGAIEALPDATTTLEPLVQSSTNVMMEDAAQSKNPDALRHTFKPSGQVKNLVVRLSGTFHTAFPDGPPQTDEESDAQKAPAPQKGLESGSEASIIVVADSDLLYDDYYLTEQNFMGFALSAVFNDNLNFLLNSCEMLTGNPALINIRSRGGFERPFTRVAELERKAQDQWLDREQALIRQVEETNQKLQILEQQKDASQKTILSEAQEHAISQFQDEKIRINKELKEVRRNLRADIDRLGTTVKFINIFLMPLLIGIGGGLFAIMRKK